MDRLNGSLEDDTNRTVLPEKIKNRMNVVHKISKKNKSKAQPPLSKSKERMLKQLQEEKKRKALELKSITLLKKYKIHDDAYSLLHSSGTIGQVGSTREKCILATRFSKSGIEVPEDAKPFKKKGKRSVDCDNEVTMEFYPDQSHLEQPCVYSGMQQREKGIDSLTCGQFLRTGEKTTCKSLRHRDPYIVLPVPEFSSRETGTCTLEARGDIPHIPCGNDRREAIDSQGIEGDVTNSHHLKTTPA